MNKIFLATFVLLFCLTKNASAVDYQIFDLRNKIFEESKLIRQEIPNSKSAAIMTSLFDSCLITMTQIDAYFSMLGIFSSIKQDQLTDQPLDFLVSWLTEIKSSNELSLKSIDVLPGNLSANEVMRVKNLKDYFTKINIRLDAELNKMSLLKKSIKIQKKK